MKKNRNGSSCKPLNWSKNDSQNVRRREALRARHGDYLEAARALQYIANINTDPETKRKAQSDSNYFRKMYYVKKKRKH